MGSRGPGSRGPSSNSVTICEFRIKQVRMGREATADDLKSDYSVRNISVIHVSNQYVRDGAKDPKEITASYG